MPLPVAYLDDSMRERETESVDSEKEKKIVFETQETSLLFT